jgi:signal transduction histidine kinase
VTAAAIRLDAAVKSGDTGADLLENTRRNLLAAVDVLDTADATHYSLDLAIARLSGTWEGLCEIECHVDAPADVSLAEDPISAAVVVDLLSEAVSNAVRYGEAEHVAITFGLDEQHLLTLTIRDDGRSQSDASMRGLGSTLLDDCTMQWTRDITAAGATLTALLPTALATQSR